MASRLTIVSIGFVVDIFLSSFFPMRSFIPYQPMGKIENEKQTNKQKQNKNKKPKKNTKKRDIVVKLK